MKTMTNTTRTAEERRLLILGGIGKDHSSIEIASEMGVRKWVVMNDIRAMQRNNDPELKQAYKDKVTRASAGKVSQITSRNEAFHQMTGMSFQQKNFENMINYYKAELKGISDSQDERYAVTGLTSSVRKTLKRNDILTKLRGKNQLTPKARAYLLQN
jgi:hypothetical protein